MFQPTPATILSSHASRIYFLKSIASKEVYCTRYPSIRHPLESEKLR